MEGELVNDTNQIFIFSGTLEESPSGNVSGKVPKCADMKTYMRNYMKSYYKQYREDNIEQAKAIDRRKYWRKKLKSVGVIMSNEEFDKYSHDDCNLIYDFIRVRKSLEEKPELLKFIH